MIEWLVTTLESWVHAGGWIGVFGASVVEEVVSFIPSSLVQLGAGFLLLEGASLRAASFQTLTVTIGLAAAGGVTIGSLVFYAIGYFGGAPVIQKWGKLIGVRWFDVEKFHKRMQRSWWDDILFFLLRATPLMPSVVLSVGPGVVRMNVFKYSLLTFAGVWVRSVFLGFIGWQIGAAYKNYTGLFDRLEYIGLAVGTVIVLWLFLRKKNPDKASLD